MKRIFCLSSIVLLSVAFPVFSDTTIQFNPTGRNAGGWSYNGSGKQLFFSQEISVVKGLNGSTADNLYGSLVYIPDLTVGGMPGGPYTLTPISSTIEIWNMDKTNPLAVKYMSGTLGVGDLFTSGTGTTADGYTGFNVDITNVNITAEGLALHSDALDAIFANPNHNLDLELSLNGGHQNGFKWMLENNMPGGDGFSGAITVIPEPATLLTLGLGAMILRRKS